MYKECKLPVKDLKREINLDRFKFNSTREIQPLNSVIGQKRAVSSIDFALRMDDSGYNLFVTGSYGTGRTTIVSDLLKKAAKSVSIPNDWVYVYNFKQADEPIALEIPSGQAAIFKNRILKLIDQLRSDLQKTFDSKDYANRKSELINTTQEQKQSIYKTLEKEALSKNIQINSTSMGFVTIPLKKGKAIEANDFQALSQNEQDRINNDLLVIQKKIQEMVRQISMLDRVLHDKVEALNENIARYIVGNHFHSILEQYSSWDRINHYLKSTADDIIANVQEFTGIGSENQKNGDSGLPYKLNKYQVNILMDNSHKNGAPVIFETNPTYKNLFGSIEKKAFQGYVYTDYTMIKSGSLLSANGGYLLLDADQLLKHRFVYEALKRALRSRELCIEDINELYGMSSTTALRPASIPLKVKVVLIGSASVYRMLHNYDEEFRKIFKVRADFDREVKNSPAALLKYSRFISRVVKEENLLEVDKEGIVAIIEYGLRLAEHQNKLSIRFGEIVKIIREASFWAQKKRRKFISATDIRQAILNKKYRHDLVEEKVHGSIIDNTVKVDVHDFVIGQVNGLAVYDLGDYSFGRPARITVNTYIGSRGVINIEREAKMSGNIHDKGILILSGFFNQQFATNMPLNFSASITFEQNYGGIDGDSASSSELYALLSSLSAMPINQGIAVTGSVNQKGEIQAIGGVNEKIEGFYQVCKAKKLNGAQGVIIPRANIKNLMLNEEVISAVKEGKFTVYAVDHISDGMRILSGSPCGFPHKDGSYTQDSIFEKVRLRLVEFAKSAHQFRKRLNEKTDEVTEISNDES